jgi:hypothetical protein
MIDNPERVKDLHRLAEIWQGLGLRVKTMPGWENRGRFAGNTFEVLGCHHTGVAFDNDRVLRDGRMLPDGRHLPGPLCNVALHANGDVILVASGKANHFGDATWPSGKSLGVEATGPQDAGTKFPNLDAYERLAAGFCVFKGNADPRRIMRDDVGIPVRLVAAHKEVAVGVDGQPLDERTRKIYGRKPDPDFDEPGELVKGTLAHGFSVSGDGFRLIDTFRNRIQARIAAGTGEDDFSGVFNNVAEFSAALNAAVRESVQAELVTVGDPTRQALFDLARRAVADEFETAGSRTRTALVRLLRNEIESEAGDLHQALRSLREPGD